MVKAKIIRQFNSMVIHCDSFQSPDCAVAYEEDENKKDNIRNRSMGSIETDFTSVTQLK